MKCACTVSGGGRMELYRAPVGDPKRMQLAASGHTCVGVLVAFEGARSRATRHNRPLVTKFAEHSVPLARLYAKTSFAPLLHPYITSAGPDPLTSATHGDCPPDHSRRFPFGARKKRCTEALAALHRHRLSALPPAVKQSPLLFTVPSQPSVQLPESPTPSIAHGHATAVGAGCGGLGGGGAGRLVAQGDKTQPALGDQVCRAQRAHRLIVHKDLVRTSVAPVHDKSRARAAVERDARQEPPRPQPQVPVDRQVELLQRGVGRAAPSQAQRTSGRQAEPA
eukprot:CAMPEP_0206288466 /NCGR_PEP_ID=MMETSP0106_2-20121207/1630_1 /ASSEMBLY_ACC=CAM_ASM_000206 /TAXON_ID=81532 /ORGANISM="Acanthoeca-like sp., Strain 10tr" /LENGTH=279 /DNA_ID=CAMNT_0053719019 /DNA_START=46 /DNA_END=881 /DNA_ORIENTATION=+